MKKLRMILFAILILVVGDCANIQANIVSSTPVQESEDSHSPRKSVVDHEKIIDLSQLWCLQTQNFQSGQQVKVVLPEGVYSGKPENFNITVKGNKKATLKLVDGSKYAEVTFLTNVSGSAVLQFIGNCNSNNFALIPPITCGCSSRQLRPFIKASSLTQVIRSSSMRFSTSTSTSLSKKHSKASYNGISSHKMSSSHDSKCLSRTESITSTSRSLVRSSLVKSMRSTRSRISSKRSLSGSESLSSDDEQINKCPVYRNTAHRLKKSSLRNVSELKGCSSSLSKSSSKVVQRSVTESRSQKSAARSTSFTKSSHSSYFMSNHHSATSESHRFKKGSLSVNVGWSKVQRSQAQPLTVRQSHQQTVTSNHSMKTHCRYFEKSNDEHLTGSALSSLHPVTMNQHQPLMMAPLRAFLHSTPSFKTNHSHVAGTINQFPLSRSHRLNHQKTRQSIVQFAVHHHDQRRSGKHHHLHRLAIRGILPETRMDSYTWLYSLIGFIIVIISGRALFSNKKGK